MAIEWKAQPKNCKVVGFHVTSSEYRSSILTHGLLPHRPAVDGNYAPDPYYDSDAGGRPGLWTQPRGVYVSPDPQESWSQTSRAMADVWAVDMRGLKVIPDRVVWGAAVIPHRVLPTRLALVDDYYERVQARAGTPLDEWEYRLQLREQVMREVNMAFGEL